MTKIVVAALMFLLGASCAYPGGAEIIAVKRGKAQIAKVRKANKLKAYLDAKGIDLQTAQAEGLPVAIAEQIEALEIIRSQTSDLGTDPSRAAISAAATISIAIRWQSSSPQATCADFGNCVAAAAKVCGDLGATASAVGVKDGRCRAACRPWRVRVTCE